MKRRGFRILCYLIVLLCCLTAVSSCETETDKGAENYTITARISQSLNSLFPLLSSGSMASRVERLVYQSLMTIDPESLELVPVLAASSPTVEITGDTFRYMFTLRRGAYWDKGHKITTEDIAFSIKLALVPGFDQSGIHTYFNDLIKFKQISDDIFSISFKGEPFLSETAISTLAILPAYVYDTASVLSEYTIDALKAMEQPDKTLKQLAEEIKSMADQDIYVGSNAYKIETWNKQSGISLLRKKNWWGDSLAATLDQFKALPSRINFALIPDDATALTAFKNHQIDVLLDVKARDFKRLKRTGRDYKYYKTTPFRFYYLCMNNKDEFLQDRILRTALAYCFDVDRFIEVQMDSMGTQIYSPIHPSSKYFFKADSTMEFNLHKARQLLTEHGYKDSNEDGYIESPEGEEVVLNILISGGMLGKTMALLLQQNAARIGIKIRITTMKFSEIRERLIQKNYQITPLALSTNPFKYDPYQSWHSDNAGIEGSNMSGFSDSLADMYIEQIRNAHSEKKRLLAYRGFQKRLQYEMPVIFVAAPIRCILTQKNILVPVSPLNYGCDLKRAVLLKE